MLEHSAPTFFTAAPAETFLSAHPFEAIWPYGSLLRTCCCYTRARMFIYYFSRIPNSYDLLAPEFGRHAAAWIEGALPGLDTAPKVGYGTPIEREGVTVLPIRLEAASPFSRLDADIELASVQPGLCQLTLSGSYESTLEAWHARGDGRTVHRLAEGFVRELIEDLSAHLAAVRPSPTTG